MAKIHIQFTLFSAFYSPLISTMTGNFLSEEGFDYEWSVAEPGVSALEALAAGTAQVVQSTISQGFSSLEKGDPPTARHFALINNMDGFFITGRDRDDSFNWSSLEGAEVLVHHGGQPMTMLKYACQKRVLISPKSRSLMLATPTKWTQLFVTGKGSTSISRGQRLNSLRPMVLAT